MKRRFIKVDQISLTHCLRELILHKVGQYLYDDELQPLLKSYSPRSLSQITIRSIRDIPIEGLHLTLEPMRDSVVLSDFSSFDVVGDGQKPTVEEVLEKYSRPLSAIEQQLLKKNKDIDIDSTLQKPKKSHSEPTLIAPARSMKKLPISSPVQPTPSRRLLHKLASRNHSLTRLSASHQKTTATQTMKSHLSIDELINNPPEYQEDHRIYASLLVLHAIRNPKALEFLVFSESKFAYNLRQNVTCSDMEFDILTKAIICSKRIKTKNLLATLGNKIRLQSLLTHEQFEQIEKLLKNRKAKKSTLKSVDLSNPWPFVFSSILMLTEDNPALLHAALQSLDTSHQQRFFLETPLADFIDAISRTTEQFTNTVVREALQHSGDNEKISMLIAQLTSAHTQHFNTLPECFFDERFIRYLITQPLSHIQMISQSISESDALPSVFQQIIQQITASNSPWLAQQLCFNKTLKPLRNLILSQDTTHGVLFYTSLLSFRHWKTDLMLLSNKHFKTMLQVLRSTACGSIAIFELLERVQSHLCFDTLTTDIAEQRQFLFSNTLTAKTRTKIDALTNHQCLSYREISTLFFSNQSMVRTTVKDKWTQLQRANISMLLGAIKPKLHEHIDQLADIFASLRAFAVTRLSGSDTTACNPTHYKLSALPPNVAFIRSLLSADEITLYEKNLDVMQEYYSELENVRTGRLDKDIVLRFMSTNKIANELLSRLSANCNFMPREYILAKHLSNVLARYFDTISSSHNPLPEAFWTERTYADVVEGECLLWLEAWSATDFTNNLEEYLKPRLQSCDSAEALLDLITSGCEAVARESFQLENAVGILAVGKL